MKTQNIEIPKISDKDLKERMSRIKCVKPCMSGTDGRPRSTMEESSRWFDLFESISHCNPRKEAFNFNENST